LAGATDFRQGVLHGVRTFARGVAVHDATVRVLVAFQNFTARSRRRAVRINLG
jgi:hypothetical protein